MFSWLSDLITAMGGAIGESVSSIGKNFADAVFDSLLKWIYELIYTAIADFFTSIDNMGVEIFELDWVKAAIEVFRLFGWALFCVGLVISAFDLAMEYQNGSANIKGTCINVLKGFFACNLLTVLPIELYKFCISLQNTFSKDMIAVGSGSAHEGISALGNKTLIENFIVPETTEVTLFMLLCLIAFVYAIVNVFFQNLKRGGILLIQISVGSLYMFSLPRGYADGFNSWIKQVAAICLTAFMQTTLLFLGLLTFPDHMLLGLGIMLSATEVPRIAQQFGLDSSVRVNMASMVHTTTSVVNLGKAIAR